MVKSLLAQSLQVSAYKHDKLNDFLSQVNIGLNAIFGSIIVACPCVAFKDIILLRRLLRHVTSDVIFFIID